MGPLAAGRGVAAEGPAGEGPAAAAAEDPETRAAGALGAVAEAGGLPPVEPLVVAAAAFEEPELGCPVVCAEAVPSASTEITSATISVLAHRILDPFRSPFAAP